MHKLIEQFVSSSVDIPSLLEQYSGRQSPVTQALILLSGMLDGNQAANGALFVARNTDIQDEDADLGIIMLAYWALALVSQARQVPEKSIEARAAIHRARNLITSTCPKEIVSLVDLADAQLADSQGNIDARDTIMKRALKRLALHSPRHPWFLAQYAIMLARSGRLSEISRKLSSVETSSAWAEIAATATLARFMNHIETCNVHQAEQLLSPVARASLPRSQAQLLDAYRLLLPLLRKALSDTFSGGSDTIPADDVTPDWALVIRSLTAGNAYQALKWSRISEKREPVCLTGCNLVSLNLLRAELAEGNIDAARRLLSLRRSHGNIHYMDSFFEARALLREGTVEQATDHFCQAAQQAEAHNAKHRLELELTLAIEIPHHLVLHLAESVASTSRPAKKQPLLQSSVPAASLPSASGTGNIIGSSQSAENLRRTVAHFARMDVPVMITGETGTGKDLIAHAIHEESDRRDKPFVAVNCASISESLLESELFGHEKGAFTGASSSRRGLFEEASDGCVFLDEIGEISPRLQAALLRVLETGEIRPVGSSVSRKTNCRILTATNADLSRMAEEGRFRQDILFRLKRLEIHIPPLRERTDDILPLASFFLNQNRSGDSNAVMSEELCALVIAYTWPGNVRELRNVIERMRLMNSDKLYYEVADIGLPIATHTQKTPLMPPVRPAIGPRTAFAPPSGVPIARVAAVQGLRKGKSRMRRLEALRALFSQHGSLTRSEIMDVLNISASAATADLKTLTSEGFIDRIQPSRSPRSAYFSLRT